MGVLQRLGIANLVVGILTFISQRLNECTLSTLTDHLEMILTSRDFFACLNIGQVQNKTRFISRLILR